MKSACSRILGINLCNRRLNRIANANSGVTSNNQATAIRDHIGAIVTPINNRTTSGGQLHRVIARAASTQ